MADRPVILATHVRHFVGPGAVRRLLLEDMTVVCHDAAFADRREREAFRAEVPGAETLEHIDPADIVAEAVARFGRLDALISNDPYPAIRATVDTADPEEFRRTLEALAVWPFTVIGKAAAVMKAAGAGRIVIISSAAPLTGIANYSMYAAARGATNALVPSLAKELARWGISVNAIAPNYIKNPDYFPPELLAEEGAMAKMLKHSAWPPRRARGSRRADSAVRQRPLRFRYRPRPAHRGRLGLTGRARRSCRSRQATLVFRAGSLSCSQPQP